MSSIMPANQIVKHISELFSVEELKNNHFYAAGKVPPMAIIRLSTQFQSLNLAKEEILFCYDAHAGGVANKGFLLTDFNLHFSSGYIGLDKIKTLFDDKGNLLLQFPNLPIDIQQKLTQLFRAIADYDEMADSNLSRYASETTKQIIGGISITINNNSNNPPPPADEQKTPPPANNDTPANNTATNNVLTEELLQLLQTEGTQFLSVCDELDLDKVFVETLQKMTNDSNIIINKPKAVELFTQDLIKIYNLIAAQIPEQGKLEQFVLAYFFERLMNENDFAQSVKLSRLNDMIANPKFQEKIQYLRELQLFAAQGEFPDELLLPTILSKLSHEKLDIIGAHYYRFAAILLKIDGNVSEQDEELLKKVLNMAQRPKKSLPNVKQTEVEADSSLDSVIAELNALVGLKHIKEDIKTLINFLKVQKARREQGLAISDKSMHSVFMGPPGTGKTTVARLLAKIYYHLGFLKRGHLVETDRAGLVSGYIGQTALKVDEVVKSAIDGVLFIDEAYGLSRGGDDKRDFGYEAVEALLKRMEDHRTELVVIVAGYSDEMRTFIESNPGLQSRFSRYFTFDHYTGSEMLEIFKTFASKAQFELTEDAEDKLSFVFDKLYEKRTPTFGNARVVRNIFEECVERQANRIVNVEPLTKEILMTLDEPDIPEMQEAINMAIVFAEKKQQHNEPATNTPNPADLMKMMSNFMPPNEAETTTEQEDTTEKTPPAKQQKPPKKQNEKNSDNSQDKAVPPAPAADQTHDNNNTPPAAEPPPAE